MAIQAPDLWWVLSSPHSTLNVWNPECGVWIMSVECWVSIISLGPWYQTNDNYSAPHTKSPRLSSMYLNGEFIFYAQNSPIQIHGVLSVECWVSVISLGPEDAPVYTRHSLFNITKSVTIVFIVYSLFDGPEITIYAISGLKLSRLRSNVYMGQNLSIQTAI